MRRLLVPSLIAVLGLCPATAAAKDDERGRPFGRGTIVPRVGLGFGWAPDLVTIGWGVGAGYFVIDGLEVGATFGGTHLLWSRAIRAELPGLTEKIPDHFFELTPMLRYVFFRNRWFSPYAFAGVGPTFLTDNPADPVIGHWVAGPGFAIGLGKHAFLDISVSFSSRFPASICRPAFTDTFETDEGLVEFSIDGVCGFRWSPGIGLGLMF